MMVKYEIKKVFSHMSSKIAVSLLGVLLLVVIGFTINVNYVNGEGKKIYGPSAVSSLRNRQKEWAGILNEEKIRQVIAENRRITSSPEYNSEQIIENEIAYSWGEGIQDIRHLLNYSFAEGFRDYNYYTANKLMEDDASLFYSNRIKLLKKWLNDEADNIYSEKEKAYLIQQYENAKTPFYYDYSLGWSQWFEYSTTIIMITMLVVGYLVSGIFPNEFSLKSDSIYFSTIYGRNKATAAKIKAGIYITSGIYFLIMLIYSVVVLLYLGFDGWNCPIQILWWKCFYNISVWKAWLLTMICGYIGCLFIANLCMFVSAQTRFVVIAVIIPFVLIFIPSFLANINSGILNKILGLLPDQLLQPNYALCYFNLYSLGNKVIGEIPLLLFLYTGLNVVLLPLLYREYSNKQIC